MVLPELLFLQVMPLLQQHLLLLEHEEREVEVVDILVELLELLPQLLLDEHSIIHITTLENSLDFLLCLQELLL